MAGTLYVVATPIGNLEDITIRALRVLREVSVIAAEDTRRTAHLLTKYGITTPTTSLHEHNERQKGSALIARLLSGDSIALVSDAGTPTVSDPGTHLISEAAARGVRVEPIPGPNAAIAALSVAGWPAETFLFLGFPPTRSKDRALWFERLRSAPTSAVFYEAPHRIVQTLEEIRERIGDLEVLIARELTKAHEELVKGPISAFLSRRSVLKGEFTVVVSVGQSTELMRPSSQDNISDDQLAREFGLMTAKLGKTRRQAIAELAKRHGMSAKQAYDAIEKAKRSGG